MRLRSFWLAHEGLFADALTRRFVINDTFRSSLCLIHPPHLIAIAAIYLAFSLHPPPTIHITAPTPSADSGPSSRTRRQSIDASAPSTAASARTGPPPPGGQTDPITFLASLDIDHTIVLEIVQEIVSLYELWNTLESAAAGTAVKSKVGTGKTTTVGADERVVGILARMRTDRQKEVQSEREKGRGTPSWKKG